jgi:hypothetical protein
VVSDLTGLDLRVRRAGGQEQEQTDQGQRDGAVTEYGSPPVIGGGTLNLHGQSQARVKATRPACRRRGEITGRLWFGRPFQSRCLGGGA